MEFERKDESEQLAGVEAEFERELRQAFEQRPAPPRLKLRIAEAVERQHQARRHVQVLWWQRIAAGVLLAAAVSGGLMWRQSRQAEERREGEMARQQVMIALRITGHALKEVNSRLARDRGE